MNEYLTYALTMLKRLKSSGAFDIFVGNFLIKFVGLFGSIFIVRFLTKEEYGLLSYIENIYSYVSIFVGLGIANGIMRYFVLAKCENERKAMYIYAIRFQTIFNLILVFCTSVFFKIFINNDFTDSVGELIFIYLLSLVFSDITYTNLSLERALLENRKYILFSGLASVLSVCLRIIGAAISGLFGVVFFKTTADLLSATAICFLVFRSSIKGFKSTQHKIIAKDMKKSIFFYSLQNMLNNGVWILFMITDVFLISFLLDDPSILADYKVAYAIPSNMAIVVSSIVTFICPYFIKHEDDHEWVMKKYIKCLKITTIIMTILFVFLFIGAKWVILILYGERYINVVSLMRIILVAFYINSTFKTFSASLLSSMGYAKQNLVIAVFAFIIQVTMAYNVIPQYGIMGLAVGNVCVYFAVTVVTMIVFKKIFKPIN